MILVCLECAADMQEIKRNVFRCPCCGWGAEQLTIEGVEPMEKAIIPHDVQEAWNTVAAFLNQQPELLQHQPLAQTRGTRRAQPVHH